MVAKARRILVAAALPHAGEDGLPADAAAAEALHGAAAGAGGAAPPGRHAGLPRRRDEAVAQQQGAAHGGGAPQTTEVEQDRRPRQPLPGGQLPAAHVPAGHRPGLQDALSAQNLGLGAQTADRWVRRYVRAALACVGLNADVKFLLGDFRQLPAVLDSWAGRLVSAPLEHSQLIRDLACGCRRELTENMRSDPGIFNFVKWLRVGEEGAPRWSRPRRG